MLSGWLKVWLHHVWTGGKGGGGRLLGNKQVSSGTMATPKVALWDDRAA